MHKQTQALLLFCISACLIAAGATLFAGLPAGLMLLGVFVLIAAIVQMFGHR